MPVADVQNLVFSSLLWLFRSTVPAGWSLQIRPGRFWKWLERAVKAGFTCTALEERGCRERGRGLFEQRERGRGLFEQRSVVEQHEQAVPSVWRCCSDERAWRHAVRCACRVA